MMSYKKFMVIIKFMGVVNMVESKYGDKLELLEQLVNIDSGSHDKAGVDLVGSHVKELYIELGFVIKEIENEKLGNCMVLNHKNGHKKKIVILDNTNTTSLKGM